MPFVYAFDHKHRKPPMELKDLLGGKGANLAEMTSVLRPAGPARLHDHHRRLPGLHGRRVARRPDRRGGQGQVRRLEKAMGKQLGDAADPLLVSVRSGAKFSMPGMMDTVLNLGLNDESVKGLADQTDDERFAYDSYRRFISMYGRIVLGIDGEAFDEPFDAAKELAGVNSDADVPAEALRDLCRRYKQVVERAHRPPFPRTPPTSCAGPSRRCSGPGTAPGPWPTGSASASPTTSGTAVNVQAMVFGNRDDNSGTGVGFTRDPATGAQGEYGDFLVNAQGEDVVAGIRNTLPLSALKDQFPKIFKELMGIFARLEAPLPGHVRHRVHHRAGQALDAPDPGRQAHRARPRCAWPST